MSFDPVTYAAVQQLKKASSAPKYEYVWISRNITVTKNAELTIRAMGAGGGGGRGAGSKGGAGGTVALKTLTVAAGDVLDVVIPAGGSGGSTPSTGGTLQVQLNSSEILSIPGGGANGVAALNPIGADWFVKSTPPTGVGGGSAMLLEGFSATATATGSGGAGVLGNGGALNGGGLLFDNGGGGFALVDITILKFTENLPNPNQGVAFSGGIGSATGAGLGGGFGGGGGVGSTGGAGGFGGGGAAGSTAGGAGGFGGGGGATNSGGGGGGFGGQGWVTLEWRHV